jgi:hypothetical protein
VRERECERERVGERESKLNYESIVQYFVRNAVADFIDILQV